MDTTSAYYDRETGMARLLGEAQEKLDQDAAPISLARNEIAVEIPISTQAQVFPDGVSIFAVCDWIICAKKSHITPLRALDQLGSSIKMTPPEMVFGNNQLLLSHKPSGFCLSFLAIEALSHCHFKNPTQQLKVNVTKKNSYE
jgi:hypothetical protein